MADEERPSEDSPPPSPWDKSFEEINLPKKNEVSVGFVLEHRNKFIRRFRETKQPFSNQEVRENIKKELDFEEPLLRGPVEVAKGENPIMAINSEQGDAYRVLFGTDGVAIIMQPHYALIENTGLEPKQIEVKIKYAGFVKAKTQDHFILSAAAARELGLKPNEEIRIKAVYQKVEDIDLDKL